MVEVSFLLKFLISETKRISVSLETRIPRRQTSLSVSLPYIGPLRSSLCVLPFSPVGLVSITEYTFS